MIDMLKVIIAIVVVALIAFIQNKINTKKNHRCRQALLPVVYFVLVLVASIVLYNYSGELNGIISSFIKSYDYLAASEMLIINVGILLIFTIIKIVLCPIITHFWKNNDLIELSSAKFYYFSEEYSEWFLFRKWEKFRKFFLSIVIGCAIACGIILGLTWLLGEKSILWINAYPCSALVVLIEIYSFINGMTKEEFEHDVLGDEADTRRVSNFFRIREIFEQMLPEPLLSAHTGYEYANAQSATDYINSLKTSQDHIDRITAEYFENEDRNKSADVDCVEATHRMMKGQNVVFFNPFYRDSSLYITLPLVNVLLSGKKCLFIVGRNSTCEDVEKWISVLLSKYSRMNELWRVALLSDKEPECEVGILSFSQLYDNRIVTVNQRFFSETKFVVMLEPSLIVNTGQIAISMISQELSKDDGKPVYCICDRYTDGLVDTMSHLLRVEIINVVASPIPRCIYTEMSWDADGDFIRQKLFEKQTKYLGNGVELAAIAIKNQAPEVTWYCETKAPIRDIKWIVGQYFPTICKYMNVSIQQKSLYEKIHFVSNLWSSQSEKEQFVIAEDEFCNMFGTMRAYLSRGKAQSFVNVFSENYLLRDYMRCNEQLFRSNPNAIPSIVPDYAKTERNTLIKLVLMMTYRPVYDTEIIEEFHLVGIEADDATELLTRMLMKYTFADKSVFNVQSVRKQIDDLTTITLCNYSITQEAFEEFFADTLKNAYFIVENEKHYEEYIDSKLFGHVTQNVLPGQFVTYDGKYYIVKYVAPYCGVVLRRASDLYDGRKYYRQIRKYTFVSNDNENIQSIKSVMDIEIAFLQKDFNVETTGYLEMNRLHDLKMARIVDFQKDPTIDNYKRQYRNKTVLRIKLPESNDKIRFTICMLISEVFRTVFPDGWQYLAVVTKRPKDIEGVLNYMVYPIDGIDEEDYIYIIEDSDIDLGLLETIERNLMRIMEIVADFLEWHFEKMREPAKKDPLPLSVTAAKAEEQKKRSFFVKMAERIRRLFGGKKEEVKIDDNDQPSTTEEDINSENTKEIPEETSEDFVLETQDEGKKEELEQIETDITEIDSEFDLSEKEEFDVNLNEEIKEKDEDDSSLSVPIVVQPEDDSIQNDNEENPDIVNIDGTDIFENDGMPMDNELLEDQFRAIGILPIIKSRYQQDCFLKFGYEEIDSRLEIEELHKYLRLRGWCNNSLTKARKREILTRTDLDIDSVNCCDFCGLPLTGVSYDMLNDGRTRCNDCSANAIATVEEFKTLFYQILEMMQAFYGIKYQVPIRIAMADARTVAKGAGAVFTPSSDFASRVLGFAQKKNGTYSLLIENGSPRLATVDTMVHEMTHIWQYLNWNDSQVINTYKMNDNSCTMIAHDIVYEGMAVWSSIQYLYNIGETYYASQQEALAESRNDIYGMGYRLYAEQYPIIKDSSLIKYSPFKSFPTIDPDKVRVAVKSQCGKKDCKC